MQDTFIRNAHLEGDTFFWQAGTTGALLLQGFTATTAEGGGPQKTIRELSESRERKHNSRRFA